MNKSFVAALACKNATEMSPALTVHCRTVAIVSKVRSMQKIGVLA